MDRRHHASGSSNGSQKSDSSATSAFRPSPRRRSGREPPSRFTIEHSFFSNVSSTSGLGTRSRSSSSDTALSLEERFDETQSPVGRVDSSDPGSCSVCSDVASRHHFVFRHVLKLEANKVGSMKDALCRCLQDFYKTVNALMNDCGGLACLHLCQLCPMSHLDEVIDDRLTTLIANDTPFEDNFERHIVDDRHIVYRVKPADYPAVSTLSFNSPIAVNRCLMEPTQGQIRRIMQKVSTQRVLNTPYNGDEEDKYPSSPILKYQQPVDLYPSCRVHLHGVDPSALHTVDDYGEAIAKYWWDELKLSHYIAALAKHQRGGSVYLGITEEKLPPSKAWKPVDDLDLGMVFQTKLKVWQDVEPGKQRVFYLSEDADVPESCTQPTGRYICQGVQLSDREKKSLRAKLLEQVKDRMLWYPKYPDDHPIRTYFHWVEGGHSDLRVVEVKVSRFHGVVFHDRCGPEAYKIGLSRGRRTVTPVAIADFARLQQICGSQSSRV